MEANVVDLLATNDRHEAARLVENFAPFALRLARPYIAHAPECEAEIRSASLDALWRCATRYEPDKGPFESFAQHRIRGACRDQVETFHSRRVRHEAYLSLMARCDEVHLHCEDAGPDPEQDPSPADAFGRFRGALHCLTARERLVLEAIYFDDRSMNDVARQFGIPPRMVQTLRDQAFEILRLHPDVVHLAARAGIQVTHDED
jgi:RNA polymerase sigma factor (sigma-70 family)